MRVLAIECATEACSAALFDGDALVDGRYEILGRGHAERLVPMIAELPGKGRAERIAVSLGPGSFTGVRIGLAAARALGLAWRAEVLGYPTLALVAAMAGESHSGDVTVCMTGGHGEWFLQHFRPDGLPYWAAQSMTPIAAANSSPHAILAGSQAEALAELDDSSDFTAVLDILPDARQFASLSSELLTADLSPIYGRAPDAKLPGVRP